MSKQSGKNKAPFLIHSSSATGGYHDTLTQFKQGVDITNTKVDTYGEFKDAPLQGPFTEKYVGGHQSRHQGLVLEGDFEVVQSMIWEETPLFITPLETPTSGDDVWMLDGNGDIQPLSSPTTDSIWQVVGDEISPQNAGVDIYQVAKRGEAYYIVPVSNALRVYGADHQGTNYPRAIYYRDEYAKRPLNIRNILSNTGSGPFEGPGNYDHNIQVVQTTGKTQNPRHFAENSENYQQFAERKTREGNTLNSLNDVGDLRNFTLPSGSANKSIITNRFSAPGDRYTMSKGFLNPSGEEYSVYNTLPYRNENVRQNLRERLTRHMSSQGYEVSGSVTLTTGSFHKVNRNTLRQLKGGAEGTTVTTGSQYDNFYIQHPIPRSDLAYAWVTASLGSDAMDSLYGYASGLPTYGHASGSSAISFNLPQKDFTERTLFDYNPTTNTTLLPLAATGPMSGAYGFSSWEAMRRTDYKSTRYIRDNNLFSFWTSDNKTYENTTVVTQSAVTSKYKPLQHVASISGDASETPFTFTNTYANDFNFFSQQKNIDVEEKLGLHKDDDETFYSTIKGYYIQPESDITNNPFGSVNKVRVSETIYPKDKSAYTVGTRSRSNYTEVAGTGENGYDRQYGKQNTFYHSTNTRSEDARNSFGFKSILVTNSKTNNFSFGTDLTLPTELLDNNSKGLVVDSSDGSVAFVFGEDTYSFNNPTLQTTRATNYWSKCAMFLT